MSSFSINSLPNTVPMHAIPECFCAGALHRWSIKYGAKATRQRLLLPIRRQRRGRDLPEQRPEPQAADGFTTFCASASDQGHYRFGANASAALHTVGQRDTAAILGTTCVLACYFICKLQPFRVAQLACRVCIFVCAFSASGALFLIFELDRPFTGLISVSDTALRHALAPL